MRLPQAARTKIIYLGLAASVALGACSGDSTAPATATASRTLTGSSAFQPSPAAKSLVGVSDGTYEFTVDPKKEQKLYLGQNALFIPPKSVCDIATSSYGASTWNDSCSLQTTPFRITAVVRNAATNHPSIDFQPALRFSPKASVYLYFYVPNGSENSKREFVMDYCNDSGVCIDESLTDPSLTTYFDAQYSVVYRRIKHFSGYLITPWDDSVVETVGDLLY